MKKVLTQSSIDLKSTRIMHKNLFAKEEMSDKFLFKFKYNEEVGDNLIQDKEKIKKDLFRICSRKAPSLL